ncbi:hypothetical protein ACU5EM_23925 [Aliivibrio wodanis]
MTLLKTIYKTGNARLTDFEYSAFVLAAITYLLQLNPQFPELFHTKVENHFA